MAFSSAIKCSFIAGFLGIGEGVRVGLRVATILHLLIFFLFHALALFFKALLVLLLELVQDVHEQLHVGHILDAQ